MIRAFVLLVALAMPAWGQEIPLTIKGDTVVVKVDRVVVVKEDQTVVRSFPFTIDAPPGSALYFWTYPAGVQALDRGDKLEVLSAPKGLMTVSLKIISVDFDKKSFLTKFGQTVVAIGDVTPPDPPKPDPPKPDPPVPPIPPAPFPTDGLRALIVYETAENTPSLSDVMSGAKTNDYMKTKGAKAGFLKLDKDLDVSKLEPWVALARKAVTTYPAIVISNGKFGYVGAIPKDAMGRYSPQLTLELLQKFGG